MKSIIMKIALGAALLSAGGCATPETRIRTALINAGLPEPS